MKAAFSNPLNDGEREIQAIIAQGDAELGRTLQAELFKQKKRLADSERVQATKITKKAQNEQRIARDKMDAAQRGLADLKRTEPLE